MARDVEIKVRLRTEEAQRQIREFRESLAETRGQSVARSLGLAPDHMGIAAFGAGAGFVQNLSGAAGNALAQTPGAGFTEASLAAEQAAYGQAGAIGQAGLGVVGAIGGTALFGPAGGIIGSQLLGSIGKAAGDIGGGVASQDVVFERMARERALARVNQTTSSRAAQGFEVDEEARARLFARFFALELRLLNNERDNRRAADSVSTRGFR